MLCGCRQQCLGPSHHSMVLPHSTTLAYYSTRTSATCTTTSSLLLTPILVPYQCRSLHYQLPWGWGALPFREPGVPKEGLLPHWMSCRMQTTYIYIYICLHLCTELEWAPCTSALKSKDLPRIVLPLQQIHTTQVRSLPRIFSCSSGFTSRHMSSADVVIIFWQSPAVAHYLLRLKQKFWLSAASQLWMPIPAAHNSSGKTVWSTDQP